MELAPKQNKVTAVPKKTNSVSAKKTEPPFFSRGSIQPKLTMGAVDDFYEREASTIAERLIRKQDGRSGQIHSTQTDRQHPGQPLLPANFTILQEVLDSAGQSLDYATKAFMESRFSNDFSNIKIHDDSKAHESSAEIKAQAFTYGNHIVFGQNKYRPHTLAGRRLLAHELTHTLQQKNGQKLIQREPDKSIVDSNEFEKAFGSTPDLKILSQVHVKANPVVKKLSDKFLRIDSDPTNLLGIWIYVEQEAEKKVVNSEGDPEMDFLFDLYKMLGKFTEAKALSEKKKYIPPKTAFYSAGYYKEVLMGDLSWLPVHPAIKKYYPWKFVETFRRYFLGPFIQVQSFDTEDAQKIKKTTTELLSAIREGSGLVENERLYVSLISILDVNEERSRLLVELEKKYRMNLRGFELKEKIRDLFRHDKLIEVLEGLNYFEEEMTLFRYAAAAIQRTANEVAEFWKKAIDNFKSLKSNQLLLREELRLFKKHKKEFTQFESPLISTAKSFFRLNAEGDMPATEQLNKQKDTASKMLLKVIRDSSLRLIQTQGQKGKTENRELAGLFGMFIIFLDRANNFLDKTIQSGILTRDSGIIDRIGFAQEMKMIGILIDSKDLIKIGEEVLEPTGLGIAGQVQKKTFIAFGQNPQWQFDPMTISETFLKFNKESQSINDSKSLDVLMKYFFYSELMKKEMDRITSELKAGENELLLKELPFDYKPIPKRVDEYLNEKSRADNDALIPRRFILKNVYFSVIPADWNKFGPIVQGNEDDKRFQTEKTRKFPNDIDLVPFSADTHYDANGIVTWIVSGSSLREFVKSMHSLYPEITVSADLHTEPYKWFIQFGEQLAQKEKAAEKDASEEKAIVGMKGQAKQRLIRDIEKQLFPLRRKALSHHRRILLKFFLRPLWEPYKENVANISTWQNPEKAIDMIIYIAGGHPWTFDKIEGKDEQAELKLQIAAVMLELGRLMKDRLLDQGLWGGAKTRSISIAAKLLPHVIGAISIEKEVLKYADKLNLEYKIAEHGKRVGYLVDLKAGLLEVLQNYYETEVREVTKYEREVAKIMLGPDFKEENIPKKIYSGDWLKGLQTPAHEKDQLEDRSSNIPFVKGKPILYEGKTYMLSEVHQNFYYRPAIKLDTGGVSWSEDLIGEANPSTLILVNGETEKQLSRKERTGGNKLFTYTIVERDGTNRTIPVDDNDDDAMRDLRAIIGFNSNMENLQTLKVVLETGAEWIKLPFYFIPGFGQAVLAGDIVVGVIQFLRSADFTQLRQIMNGDGLEMLSASYDSIKERLGADMLWDMLLDDTEKLISVPPASKPKPKDNEFTEKSDGKLKKILLAFSRFGTKILNGLARVKNMVNFTIKKIRSLVLNKPMLAGTLAYVVNNFYLLSSSIKLPDLEMGADPKEEDAGPFSKEIQEMLDHLTQLQVPKDLLPIDVIIDVVVRIAMKSLRGPKGIIAGSVKKLLEKAGVYDKILKLVADQLKDTMFDPNKYLNEFITDKIQPQIQKAGAAMANEISDVMKKFPVFKNLSMPGMKEIKTLEDSGDDVEQEPDEEPAESQPYPSSNAILSNCSPLPRNVTGGMPLTKTLLEELSRQYGQNFSHVRIHGDEEAMKATKEAGAEALTSGSHIYLSSGLSPTTEPGKSVVKHELAHVLQQTGTRPSTKDHSDTPVSGKPGSKLVLDPKKEEEADRFAKSKEGIPDLSYDGINQDDDAVYPKLTDVVLKFFKSVSAPQDLEARKYILKASSHARITDAEKLFAKSLGDKLKTAAKSKITFTNKMEAGRTVIVQYFSGKDSIYDHDYSEFVRLSKVKKRVGKSDADETNWELNLGRFEVALEEFIAFETGIMLDIELSKSAGGIEISKFKVNNIFLENIRLNANIWKLLIENTFLPAHRPKSAYKDPADLDKYKEASKYLIKALDVHHVLAGEGFKFSNGFASKVEDYLYPDTSDLHTGEPEDPIPIYWYKKTNEDYPKTISIGNKEYSMVSSTKKRFISYGTEQVQIGVDPQFIIRSSGGGKGRENATLMLRGKAEERTTKNTKNYRLALAQSPGGYKMRDEDVDHVTDLGFSGPDTYENFWPLKSSINRIPFANQWYDQYKVAHIMKKGDKQVFINSLRELQGKFFTIKGYSRVPERPGGRWAKR